MPIHEENLIRPENLKTHENLVIDGIDVSGHWSTFIEPRVVTDYNEKMEEEIAALPGGENIHPEEIENVLLDLPDVRQAVVVSVADSKYGQRPAAIVDVDELDERRYREYLERFLP